MPSSEGRYKKLRGQPNIWEDPYGYLVNVHCDGEQLNGSFAASAYGGKAKALKKAIEFRDTALSVRNTFTRVKKEKPGKWQMST